MTFPRPRHNGCGRVLLLLLVAGLVLAVPLSPPSSAQAPTASEDGKPAGAKSTDTKSAPTDAKPAPDASPLPESPLKSAPADQKADAKDESLPPAPAPVAESKPPVIGAAHLPRDLSPWSMFVSADMVVKGVMIGLAFASVVTWTVWLAKSIELLFARRRVRTALGAIGEERSLAAAAARIGTRGGVVASFLGAAQLELQLSADVAERAGIKERVASRLTRLEVAAAREMNKGTG